MRRFFGSRGSISRVTIESQALKNNMLDDSWVRAVRKGWMAPLLPGSSTGLYMGSSLKVGSGASSSVARRPLRGREIAPSAHGTTRRGIAKAVDLRAI